VLHRTSLWSHREFRWSFQRWDRTWYFDLCSRSMQSFRFFISISPVHQINSLKIQMKSFQDRKWSNHVRGVEWPGKNRYHGVPAVCRFFPEKIR
jgi:hypothetical protein